MLFLPVFPFPLGATASGGRPNIFVRPAIPLVVDQPVPTLDGGAFDYDKVTTMDDWGFDLAQGLRKRAVCFGQSA